MEHGLSEDMYICGLWEGKGTGGKMRSSFWKGVVKYTLKQKQKPLPIFFFYSDGDLEQGVASFIYYLLNLFIF